jgi:hypothetical protein
MNKKREKKRKMSKEEEGRKDVSAWIIIGCNKTGDEKSILVWMPGCCPEHNNQ